MYVNGVRALTYKDFLKGCDPKGNFVHKVIDMTARANEMLDDICIVEANDGTTLQTTVRTEIPLAVWDKYYGGIPSNKGSKSSIRATCGRLATKILVAKKLYDDAPNKDAVVEDEIAGAMSGMKLQMAQQLIWGKVSDNPLGFNGLLKHLDHYDNGSLDETSPYNFVFNGELSDKAIASYHSKLRNILLVGWSPNTITCFHPEGHTTGGISKSERRTTDIPDSVKGGDATYEALIQYLYWELGMAVRDTRYMGAVRNIQLDQAYGGTGTTYAQHYVELIDRLAQRVYDDNGVKQAFYMDKGTWEMVCTMFSRMTRVNAITFNNVEGRKEKKLFGIPVRIQEAMAVNDDIVTVAS